MLLVDGYNVLMRRLQQNVKRERHGVGSSCEIDERDGFLESHREELINDTRDYALTLRCRYLSGLEPCCVSAQPGVEGFRLLGIYSPVTFSPAT